MALSAALIDWQGIFQQNLRRRRKRKRAKPELLRLEMALCLSLSCLQPDRTMQAKGLIIHDADADWTTINDEDEEEAPLVVPRSKQLSTEEAFRSKFKSLGDDGNNGTSAGAAGSRKRIRHDSPDNSPPRGRVRHDSPDKSPPRRGRVRHDSPDNSPPRRGRVTRNSPDNSPPRRGRRVSQSPPRRGRAGATDSSPPRRGRAADSSPPRQRASGAGDSSPPRRPVGGLLTAATVREEALRKQVND